MPDSIIPYIVVPAALALFYFLLVVQPKWEKAAKEKADRIMTRGREFVAFVQMANDKLFEASKEKGCSFAQVVYIRDADVADLEDELLQIGGRLAEFEVQNPDDATEKLIGSVMRTQLPWFEPIRLPTRVAGTWSAYTVSLRIHWSKFKDRKLGHPFLRIRVLDGEPDGVMMVPEPGSSFKM